jgi:uncharacterized membrane protein (DUF485 family)
LFLVAVYVVSSTLYWIFHNYFPVPVLDEWSTIAGWFQYKSEFGSAWGQIHRQHNEHRILIPCLFFYSDLEFFRASGLFPLISLIGIQVLHTAILCRVFISGLSLNVFSKLASGSFLFILMFSTLQINNLIWAFQIQFVAVYFFATLSFLFLVRPESHARRFSHHLNVSSFPLAVLFATAASFSMTNGLLVWIVGLLIGVHKKWNVRRFAVFLLSGFLVWFLYFKNFRATSTLADTLNLLIDETWPLLQYIAALLGTPLAPKWIDLAIVFGLAGIVCTSVLSILFLLDRRSIRFQSTAAKFFVSLALFVLFTGILTGLGRLDMGGPTQATSNRYGTTALLFWIANIGVLFTLTASEAKSKLRLNFIVALLIFLSLINVLTFQLRLNEIAGDWNNRKYAGASSLIAGVTDTEYLHRLFPRPSVLLQFSNLLKKNGLSLYGTKFAQFIGTSTVALFPDAISTDCLGYIDKVTVVGTGSRRGVRVEGWAFEQSTGRIPDGVLFVRNNKIIGVGFPGRLRPDVDKAYPGFLYSGWLGHARLPADEKFETYVLVNNDKNLCKLTDRTQ